MNIEFIKKDLVSKFPHFAEIINNCDFVVDKNIPSVATDGKAIYYNPDFMTSITEEQQKFAIINAILHVAFNHNNRAEGKDQLLWNIATDAIINENLKREGLSAVEGSINIPGAINYSAEELYNKLLEEKEAKSIQPENWNGEMYAKLIEEFTQKFIEENKD